MIVLQNCVLGRYIQNFMRHGKHNTVYPSMGPYTIAAALERRTDHLQRYLCNLPERIPPSSLQYWKKYGRIAPNTLGKDDDNTSPMPDGQSLYKFPGRHWCREGIVFEKLDRQECTKKYFKGQSIFPTFLTVQYTCAHAKLIGFVVLRECESISSALSPVLKHFPVPPRTVWYDNACNTYDCAMIPTPWFLRLDMIIVDRFHLWGTRAATSPTETFTAFWTKIAAFLPKSLTP